MGLHRTPGEMQLASNLGARMPQRDQTHNLGLASCQSAPGDRPSHRLKARGDPRAHVLLTTCSRSNRTMKLDVGKLLEHETDRSSVECLLRKSGTVFRGEHDDLGARHLLAQSPDRLDARSVREAEIEYQHVRQTIVHVTHNRR